MELAFIHNKIYEVRGKKVMFDYDLAGLYKVQTKVLKQSVKRNRARFPIDFMFELSMDEFNSLRSQFVTLKAGRGQHSKYPPYAFTEQGISMLSSVLNSDRAIEVNIAIMRTFVLIREYALNYKELQEKLLELEKQYNKNFKDIYNALNLLIQDQVVKQDQTQRQRIGFKTKSS